MRFKFTVGTRQDAMRLSRRLSRQGISSNLNPISNGQYAVSGRTASPEKAESAAYGIRVVDSLVEEE